MKVLELFAGSCSFSNVAKELGYETFTTDIKQFGNIDYVVDIMDFDYNKVPFVPDIIWASPPCTCFSVGSIGTHWMGGMGAYIPKTNEAKLAIKIVKKMNRIIEYYKPLYFYIENPRGILRKLNLMYYIRRTIWYCQYGDKRAKPTDIWTNDWPWYPKPVCRNYRYDKSGQIINRHCHHISARRGAKTGTQGLKGSYERSKVPRELCLEILKQKIKDDQNIKKTM